MIARTPARRGIEERNQLVAENMGLAYSVALRWIATHPTMTRKLGGEDDVKQIALAALVKAATLYDASVSRFSTYASMTVYRLLMRAAMSADPLRIPLWVGHEERAELWERLTPTSLTPLVEGGFDAPAPEDATHIETAELSASVKVAMRRLPRSWQRVLRRRSEGWSLRRLGLDMGITSEAVRHIEGKALAKLRAILGAEDVAHGGFPAGRRECVG